MTAATVIFDYDRTLSPGDSCEVEVVFEPLGEGSVTATLAILSASLQATADLAGTGEAPPAPEPAPQPPPEPPPAPAPARAWGDARRVGPGPPGPTGRSRGRA